MTRPGGYIFSTHHTESVFVLLMILGLISANNGRWILASVFAGLTALTRNQGVAVILTIAIASALNVNGRQRGLVLLGSVAIGYAIHALYPLYQWILTGNAFMSVQAQLHWRPEMTLSSYLRSLWFGNSWQVVNSENLLRYCFFLSLVGCVVLYARNNLRRPEVIFCLACIALMPMSGEFVGVFRYAIVLFPMMFWVGDRMTQYSGIGYIVLLMCSMVFQFKLYSRFLHSHWSY